MRRIVLIVFWSFACFSAAAQDLGKTADSLRLAGEIPELSYTILTKDSILVKNTLGFHRSTLKNDETKAQPTDYMHLGSNTKAITGMIAAYLVEQRKISWTAKLFALFPEWKAVLILPIMKLHLLIYCLIGQG